jgi:hypothetical protein
MMVTVGSSEVFKCFYQTAFFIHHCTNVKCQHLLCGQFYNVLYTEDHVVSNDGMTINWKEFSTGDGLIMLLSQNIPGQNEENTGKKPGVDSQCPSQDSHHAPLNPHILNVIWRTTELENAFIIQFQNCCHHICLT